MTQEQRQELIRRRQTEYQFMDFAYPKCPACGRDTVQDYGNDYPTASITGCRGCHRSWCD